MCITKFQLCILFSIQILVQFSTAHNFTFDKVTSPTDNSTFIFRGNTNFFRGWRISKIGLSTYSNNFYFCQTEFRKSQERSKIISIFEVRKFHITAFLPLLCFYYFENQYFELFFNYFRKIPKNFVNVKFRIQIFRTLRKNISFLTKT